MDHPHKQKSDENKKNGKKRYPHQKAGTNSGDVVRQYIQFLLYLLHPPCCFNMEALPLTGDNIDV